MPFYSFDTSALLNGRREILPPKTFKSTWIKIEDMIRRGSIRCVDEVKRELQRRSDEPFKWAKAQEHLFVP